jgi:hypothetical protein
MENPEPGGVYECSTVGSVPQVSQRLDACELHVGLCPSLSSMTLSVFGMSQRFMNATRLVLQKRMMKSRRERDEGAF